MKHKGAIMEYSKERMDDLMRAYDEYISSCDYIRMSEVYKIIVNMPSRRFWVSDIRAALIISAMMRGKTDLSTMCPLKKEMYEEIYNRVFKLQEECPGLTISELCAKVIAQPDPKFYLTPGSAKVMVCKKTMDTRKMEKITALVISTIVVGLSFFKVWDWQTVGIYAGSDIAGRVLYPFFHANILHASLNSWCLLSMVFIYDIGIWRLVLAYIIAVTIPIDTIECFIGEMTSPTVGLSGIVFVLFGSISFEVLRKQYYQLWMIFYLTAGFLFPHTNAILHLWCYMLGFLVALLNKPIIKKSHD